ncbi:hypothetical protein BCR32DRAFT_270778 [Anaeromyces robustus]|uniref:Protein PBN1 n=1 Tax=Anaeromyces robustus TaxID=1754192 RepID=A0A1Y1WVT5_9FUNG|nr:hypothetical protein BCR32DRAFT_270778 [Anaeromyces robustus]|eukprot:ORX77234.1 hypothetical protein BCR32DRAFT_270778 [Anaeromyces robustus]
MLNKLNISISLFILLSLFKLTFAITQEWLFWPSNPTNGTLIVNSAENKSKIKNANKTETLHLRYSITDEVEKFIPSPSLLSLNEKIASIDITYISSEIQWNINNNNINSDTNDNDINKKYNMDKNFMPLFGTYETGLHIAITTNEDMKGRDNIQRFLEDNCDFINQLFHESGYLFCQKEDYIHFKNLIKISQIGPRYFYMFLSDFTLDNMEGFSLYHIFKLGKNEKTDLDLGCDFDDEVISEWTSKYFHLVISSQALMLNENDKNDKEEGELDNLLMMTFEEILHFKFPETVQCNVNQHLSNIKFIETTQKTSNNGYTITTINPRGVKNDELVFIPCPLPNVKFSYKLNPGVGLHPILFTTIEVDHWVENQPLVMLLTLDPNIFADEYQINDQKYDKNVRVNVLGHPDLEVAVNDPQAKYNYVKVIFDALAPKTNITLEIPFHVRYPESEPISINNNNDKNKENESNNDNNDKDNDKTNNKENKDNSIDPHLYKTIFIQPPRFYTTSTKLCHQEAYNTFNLPMNYISSINKKDQNKNKVSIIPVQVLPRHEPSKIKEEDIINGKERNIIIPPLHMDIPKGQLNDYSKITIITTFITIVSIIFIFIWTIKYSNSSPISEFLNLNTTNKKKN